MGGLHYQANLALERQLVGVGGTAHDLSVIAGVAQNALDLGMARLAHDDHTVALAHQALGGYMDLLNVGAGGVDHGKAALASGVNDLRHHTVGADDHGARYDGGGVCLAGHGLGGVHDFLAHG